MKYSFLIFIIIMLGPSLIFSSSNKNLVPDDYDTYIKINENTINRLLRTSDLFKSELQLNLGQGISKYKINLKQPTIDLKPKNSTFSGNLIIDLQFFKYEAKTKGNVDVQYNQKSNKIIIKITNLEFVEEKGFSLNEANINLSDYLKPEFELDGPELITTTLNIKRGKEIIEIKVEPKNPNLFINDTGIIFASNMSFTVSN